MLAGFLDVGRLRAVSTFIALLIAAATADASPAPTATGSSSLPISGRVLINRGGGSPLTKGAASGATLKYYGGPLIRNVQVFPMFYGEALYQKELTDWYKVVVNSSYMDILAEYSTPNYQLGRGSLIGTYKFTTNLKDKLDDVADVQPLLRSLVKTGVLNPNENTYYPIHLRPSTSVIQGGDTSCVTFCGYHGTIDISDISKTKYLYYGIIADQTGDCFGGCGASTNPLYNAESVAAHELMEAITDPGVALAATYSAPLGWYDKTNGEIGDICNAMQSSMVVNNVKYVIQKEWSNQQSACIALPGAPYSSKGPSPTPTASCHDVCIPGDPLSPSCGSVAACVIKADSFCGVVSWDAACIKLAVSNCGASCSKTYTSYGIGSTSTSYAPVPTTTTTYGNPPPDCHDPCIPGGPMGAQCGDVAKCVGQMDSYCQSTNWDSICVSEAGQCGASCSGGGYSTDYPTPTYSYPSYSYPSYSYPTYYSSSALPSYTPVVCHDVCSIGDPLDQNCGSIASCVIASDSYCKVAKWDSICVAEAQVCGASCYTTPTPTPTPTPGYTPSPTYSSATYTDDNGCHDVCLLGGPMTADCSDVASCVVGQASSCGTDQWDATCVSLADQCGGGCSSSTSATTATTATSSCHDVCSVGLGMDETCGDVATCVVGLNSTCYTTWDSTCVGTAVSSCNANCTTPSTPLPDMICHDPCLVGGALPARCGTEVACVLQTNPECETDSWSSNCVSVLQSSCSVDCTASTWTQPCVPKTAVIFSSVSTTTATSTSVTTAITTVPTTTTTTSLKVSTLTKTATTSTTKTTTSQTTTTQLTTVTTKATKTTTTTSVSTVLSTAPKWTTTIPTTTTVVSVSVSPTTTTKVVTATTTAKTAIVKSTILVVSTTVVKTTVTPPAIKTVTVSK